MLANGWCVEYKGQWWKVPAKADPKLAIYVASCYAAVSGGALFRTKLFQRAEPDKREVVFLHATLPLFRNVSNSEENG